jgi:hypothetical protein
MITKYPRTPHLPWSPGLSDGDRRIESLDELKGNEVVVTEKMDGENTSLYRDAIHARSLAYKRHPSRAAMRALWEEKRAGIPPGIRIVGENCFARHSIVYQSLPHFFMVFSIWDSDVCLSWDQTVQLAKSYGFVTVPILRRMVFEEKEAQRQTPTWMARKPGEDPIEGFVVRRARDFPVKDFPLVTAKYVRAGHVQTNEHWMLGPMIRNSIRKNDI